jgi:ribosomal protein S18 acetylase RimI-like enzyme
MIVRRATVEDDVAAVVASAIATLRQTYRPTRAAIERKAARAHALTRLVAVTDGEIVGTVEYEVAGDRVHVIGLGVLDAHRGRGVARRLIDELVDIAAGAGARVLSLYTIRETGNVPVFERLRFAVAAEKPAADCESDRHARLIEVFMERRL